MSELSIRLHECPNCTADFHAFTILCQVKKETTKEKKPPTIQCNAQALLYLSFVGEQASHPASLCPPCLDLGVLGWERHVWQWMSPTAMCHFQTQNRQTPGTWISWRQVVAGSWKVFPAW